MMPTAPGWTLNGRLRSMASTASRILSALSPGSSRRPAVALRDRPVLGCRAARPDVWVSRHGSPVLELSSGRANFYTKGLWDGSH